MEDWRHIHYSMKFFISNLSWFGIFLAPYKLCNHQSHYLLGCKIQKLNNMDFWGLQYNLHQHDMNHNQLKWRFLYARHPRNFSHYLEHIKERDAKSYFPSDDHRSPFLLPRLSSEPMIISEITAKHKKAIRWDHHQALRLGNQNSHQPFMKYLLYSNGLIRNKM